LNRFVGRGWATVDLDRAATELADLIEPGSAFTDAPRSEIRTPVAGPFPLLLATATIDP